MGKKKGGKRMKKKDLENALTKLFRDNPESTFSYKYIFKTYCRKNIQYMFIIINSIWVYITYIIFIYFNTRIRLIHTLQIIFYI